MKKFIKENPVVVIFVIVLFLLVIVGIATTKAAVPSPQEIGAAGGDRPAAAEPHRN